MVDNCGKDFETVFEHRQAGVTLDMKRIVCGVTCDRAAVVGELTAI